MGPQQAGKNIMDELSAKQEAIIDNLGWDELGDKERIERLRKYTKQTINAYAEQYGHMLNGLLKRIEQLERHKHDTNGRAIIEQYLDTGRALNTDSSGGAIATPASYNLTPGFKINNSKYI